MEEENKLNLSKDEFEFSKDQEIKGRINLTNKFVIDKKGYTEKFNEIEKDVEKKKIWRRFTSCFSIDSIIDIAFDIDVLQGLWQLISGLAIVIFHLIVNGF